MQLCAFKGFHSVPNFLWYHPMAFLSPLMGVKGITLSGLHSKPFGSGDKSLDQWPFLLFPPCFGYGGCRREGREGWKRPYVGGLLTGSVVIVVLPSRT
ncbi:hypothetical protein M404DRAFT_702758 [Pisolithus tinctorius Marx 270]|uniref:Uncharacterized protein n=1 Tax=Pisolithus tinctorius Marx 270 TaxID=870435 RepID=A0A0C3PG62_PISTI|nr:hypothetical protein M404DRAFT_702758 [Pisolithus tinctorius Marx 270]